MSAHLTWRRTGLLVAVTGSQVAIQAVAFLAGLVLVRWMPQVEYGHYTLAMSLMGTANVLTDLGLGAAVMATAGRLVSQGHGVGTLLADARHVHRRIASVALLLCLPVFAWMLSALGATGGQTTALTLLIAAAVWCNVRSTMAMSILRVQGRLAYPQAVELGIALGKLALFGAALWIGLTSTFAVFVVACTAALQMGLLMRRIDRGPDEAAAPHSTRGELISHLRRQGPNAIYYVVSTQFTVWLIGLLGAAERVAEVGALSRLAAVFTIVGAVSAALIQPYFARRQQPAELSAVFAWTNAFYGAVFATVTSTALLWPQPILWVLGPQYAHLGSELPWMVASATLTAWGAALYSLGTVRSWVQPIALTVLGGVAAVALTIPWVDMSSVRGVFIVNTALGLAGAALSFGFVALRLRRFARLRTGATDAGRPETDAARPATRP